MKKPDRPPDEARRLEALRRYEVLDTLPEQSLDDLTALAAHICDAPIALISLIDERRQWFKSRVGMSATETARDVSFCGHAILGPDLFVVPDAEADARFADNPLVTEDPHIHFYAGAPLITSDGHALGALCVMDRVARRLSPEQEAALTALSRQVIAQLDLSYRTRELRASEERLRIVTENARIGLVIVDAERRYLYANRAYAEILGLASHEIVGLRVPDVLPALYEGQIRPRLDRAFAGERMAYDLTRKVGDDELVFAVRYEPTDVEGRGTLVIVVITDITEQRRSEVARRESEARYRTLFDYAPDGILIGDPRSTYLDANRSICRMLGYERDELVGLNAVDVIAPAEVPEIEGAIASIHSRQDHHREWQFRRKDGSVFTAEVMATEMPDGNLLGMIRDVTDRKRLEQQFLRAQRMESIGTLAGGIAHDLNNVFAPILMAVELLLERVDDEDGRGLLETLEGSVIRGSELVKQVLTFARGIEGRRLPLNPLDVLKELQTVVRETFPKEIDARVELEGDPWPVTGDSTQLHQVLLNLCVNARDAMPEGGTLRVTADNVVLDETFAAMNPEAKPGPYVRIAVTDSGTGIPPEIQGRLFEPFFTTKDVGKGTGLGLSTALAIAKSHGGFLLVQSELGAGTRFEVYLPADREVATAAGEAAGRAELPRGAGELILVVDDEEAIRKIARRTLERFGYRVVTAADGAEALRLYNERHAEVAAVLTDMAMPVMGGRALIRALKERNPGVRVIGSSGLSSGGGLTEATGAGALQFVPKPYTAATLLAALRRALSSG